MEIYIFVVLSTSVGQPEQLKATLPAHLAYQSKLESEGTLVLAGPMSDETGEEMQGMGLVIYRAASFNDVHAFAQADPMHSTGARSFVLRKWMINEGSLNISVGLSSQTVKLV